MHSSSPRLEAIGPRTSAFPEGTAKSLKTSSAAFSGSPPLPQMLTGALKGGRPERFLSCSSHFGKSKFQLEKEERSSFWHSPMRMT